MIPGNLINPPEQIVKAFSWHKYKQKIALGVGDIIQIYSIINQEGSWEKLETLKIPFQAEINEIQWKPLSGNMLAVACQTGVIVWDSEWMVKFLNIENVKNVTSLQWHPFLPLLAVGSPHDSVIIWDITTSIPTHLHSLSPSSSYLLRWSPNGHYLFHASLLLFSLSFCFFLLFLMNVIWETGTELSPFGRVKLGQIPDLILLTIE